jgi:hypothetical protein
MTDNKETVDKKRLKNTKEYEKQTVLLKKKDDEDNKKLSDDEKLAKLKENCFTQDAELADFTDVNAEKCTLKKCPDGFEISTDKQSCEMDIDDIEIYRYERKDRCEEQYIDWISIPNYHLGNNHFKLNTGKSETDFNSCFEPCSFDFIPYKDTNDRDASKSIDSIHCVRKKIKDLNIYGKTTLDYCPLVLIILLSCKESLSNEFKTEYIKEKTKLKENQEIESEILANIKDDNTLLDNMYKELKFKGKEYIKHLYTEKPDFLEKLQLKDIELSECYKTSILKLPKNKQIILEAYKVFKDDYKDDLADLDKYANSYGYIEKDGDVTKLKDLHKKVLKWACEYTFDENTNYGRNNIFLYESYNKKKVIDPNNEYIRQVKNNKILNELTIFTPLELLHPGNVLKKIIYKDNSDNILENSFILSSPSTILLLLFFIILIVIAIVFYEYTKPLYGRLREIFIIMIYNIAKIFNSSVDPKYIVSTLLNNVKNQVDNPRPIPTPMA